MKLIHASDSRHYHQVTKAGKKGDVLVAEGFEVVEKLGYGEGDKELKWEERRLFVRSIRQGLNLEQRFLKVREAIENLTKKKKGKCVLKTRKEYQAEIAKLLKANKVEGLLRVKIMGSKTIKEVRAYKEKPARRVVTWRFQLSLNRNREAIEAEKALQGWQVYATNVEQRKLLFEACV